jgi:hypothetical protein
MTATSIISSALKGGEGRKEGGMGRKIKRK